MFSITRLTNPEKIPAIVTFLQSAEAFDLEMNDYRKRAREKAVKNSLILPKHAYWYVEHEGNIIGAVGVAENDRESDGYYLDYFAVHKEFRRHGIGRQLIQTAEDYLASVKARYLLIDTGDNDDTKAARHFYEAMGYKPVSHIPDYYYPGEGRIDYWKKLD
jgi:ribosomal protein S18 acetylase RimI-like enzyme